MNIPKEPYIFEMPLKVRDYEVDSQGIVNNANYLHYLEHTRHEFCQERGVSFRDMQRQGIDPVVSKIEISYLTPLRLAETMTSCLWMERRGARFIFHQDIFNAAGKPIVTALVTIVALEDGKLTRGEQLARAFSGQF
jgi:acyl-CoA thioester hydrolase